MDSNARTVSIKNTEPHTRSSSRIIIIIIIIIGSIFRLP